MTLQEVVARFNTTPFLFAGSGITRRYYGLPDWVGLLTYFAEKVKKDPFAYRFYENKASETEHTEEKLPLVASYIEKDFNDAWFNNEEGIRSDSEKVYSSVSTGVSPFKAEISEYIASLSTVNPVYADEVEKLRNIAKDNLSGVITTNYDCFFENIFDGYKTFVGQDELVFSQLQGIAEIYKIHGSVQNPESIVINKADYQKFYDKGKYLAAKLMTIFMEYPIIFIGYSISDSDIQAILSDVVECLPLDKIETLQKRFILLNIIWISLEDGRIDENMLALSIGLTTTGVYGLARAVNSEQWYRNIILHDSLYSCEQLLEFVYPELAKQNSWKLPVWYYISKSNMKSELAEEKAPHSYTEIVTESTIKRNRSAIGERTAWEVWTQEKDNLMKAIRLLGCMPEEKIDVNQYRSILQAIFTENNNILSSLDSPNRSNLHRMIRIYDFLEYGQKKTP